MEEVLISSSWNSEWIVFCLKVVLVEYAHWASYPSFLMAIFCYFCRCCRCIQPHWVGSTQLCLFDWLEPRWRLSKTQGISTKDVSRDCPLSHGGFWRSRVSSSEPETKRQERISESHFLKGNHNEFFSKYLAVKCSISPCHLHAFMFSSIYSKCVQGLMYDRKLYTSVKQWDAAG